IAAKWIALAALASMVFLLLMRAVVRGVDVQLEGPSGIWRWGRSLITGPVVPGGASGWVYANVLAVSFVLIPAVIYVLAWIPFFLLRYRSLPAALITLGFVTQYLPWSRITRVLFLYHMFGGLPFMILALAFVLAWMGRSEVALAGPSSIFPLRYLAYLHLAVA